MAKRFLTHGEELDRSAVCHHFVTHPPRYFSAGAPSKFSEGVEEETLMAFGIAQIDPVLYFLFGLCLSLLVYPPQKPASPGGGKPPSDKFRVMKSVGVAIVVGLLLFGLRMMAGEAYGRGIPGIPVTGASMIPSSE